MRSFIAAALLVAGVAAQTTLGDIDACANAILDDIDVATMEACSNKSNTDCICSTDLSDKISDKAIATCTEAGINPDDLKSTVCSTSKSRVAAPARHASKPMEPASNLEMDMAGAKRAYAPPIAEHGAAEPAVPRVIYVTETKTECGCKPSATPFDPSHLSQIPVQVPASSSMGGMAAASAPAYSDGVVVGASSASWPFGSHSATPTPSGASAQGFSPFQGSAPTVAVHGGVAALGVAAVMGLMIAL
ncbi:hypothetical protein N7507_011008 [Penicillium longicatenatum]|nr:hypothetical protein N7507_011008 [Penicillium longicatenatum]